MKLDKVTSDPTLCARAALAPGAAGALGHRLRELWQGLSQLGSRRPRRLRLCESLALGDRRIVAVIEFEGLRFLVGGTSSSLILLDRLDAGKSAKSRPVAGETIDFGPGKESW